MLIRTIVSAALTLTWLALALPAVADCELARLWEVLPEAQVAFVGSVVALDGPVATFAVDEVWVGEVGTTVEVRGLVDRLAGRGGQVANPIGEDDRTWTVGTTYLVLPWADGGILRDGICTATTEWQPELASLRPSDARVVTPSESRAAAPVPLLIAGAVVVLITLASVLAFRRR